MTPLDWHINSQYANDFITNSLGPIPQLIDGDSPMQIAGQLEAWAGWSPQPNDGSWTLFADDYLSYKGTKPVAPVAYALHLGERILVYPRGWTVIVQLNGSFQLARII